MSLIEELLGPEPEWMRQAVCTRPGVDPSIFTGPTADVARARQICRRCPVLTDCDAWALDHADPGSIWAGMPR